MRERIISKCDGMQEQWRDEIWDVEGERVGGGDMMG